MPPPSLKSSTVGCFSHRNWIGILSPIWWFKQRIKYSTITLLQTVGRGQHPNTICFFYTPCMLGIACSEHIASCQNQNVIHSNCSGHIAWCLHISFGDTYLLFWVLDALSTAWYHYEMSSGFGINVPVPVLSFAQPPACTISHFNTYCLTVLVNVKYVWF